MVWLMRGLGGDPPDSLNDGEKIANVADCVKSGLHTTLDVFHARIEAENESNLPFLADCIETLHFSALREQFGEAGKFFGFSDFSYCPPPPPRMVSSPFSNERHRCRIRSGPDF